ncbi:MAG TPA: class I SAM-dependent methyltransferase [Candidatus Limnocylindria bacterium]
MTDALHERRRRSFDAIADRYLAHRPPYPVAVLDLVAEKVPPPADVLEVGPGPGLATIPLAARGYRIVAVELGERLAAEARRQLAGYDKVQVVTADFEQWQPPRPHAFDLVLAASAWHWIDPAVGHKRAWLALRAGGWLALMANHPRPGRLGTRSRRFWAATDAIYRRHAPELVRRRGWNPSRLPDQAAAIRRSGRFTAVERHVVAWRHVFDPDDYVALLDTYSDHRILPARRRERLFDDIRRLARDEFGGQVPRYYRTVLYLARSAPQG